MSSTSGNISQGVTGAQMIAEFERIKKIVGPPPEATEYYVNRLRYYDLMNALRESKVVVFTSWPAPPFCGITILIGEEIPYEDYRFYYRVFNDGKSELVLSKELNP